MVVKIKTHYYFPAGDIYENILPSIVNRDVLKRKNRNKVNRLFIDGLDSLW